jgi:hypothetical protein
MMKKLYSSPEHKKMVAEYKAELAARPAPRPVAVPCKCEAAALPSGRWEKTYYCPACGAEWKDNSAMMAWAEVQDILQLQTNKA